MGFPSGANDEEPACQCRRHKRHGFDPWVGKIPWWRAWQPIPIFLPGEAHGWRSLAGYSLQSHKSQTRLKGLSTHIWSHLLSLLRHSQHGSQTVESQLSECMYNRHLSCLSSIPSSLVPFPFPFSIHRVLVGWTQTSGLPLANQSYTTLLKQ